MTPRPVRPALDWRVDRLENRIRQLEAQFAELNAEVKRIRGHFDALVAATLHQAAQRPRK